MIEIYDIKQYKQELLLQDLIILNFYDNNIENSKILTETLHAINIKTNIKVLNINSDIVSNLRTNNQSKLKKQGKILTHEESKDAVDALYNVMSYPVLMFIKNKQILAYEIEPLPEEEILNLIKEFN